MDTIIIEVVAWVILFQSIAKGGSIVVLQPAFLYCYIIIVASIVE